MRNTSIWREASRIVYEEGLRAFWKGNLVTIAHRLPYSSISFYTYEKYKNWLQMIPGLDSNGGLGADVGVRMVGGGLSGITAASLTYPLDLVRTRLAAQTNTAYYRGISHALFAICRDEGPRGLYKGLGPTLLGVGPSIAISFSVYETLRSHWLLERPCDSPIFISLACGSLSGVASSTFTFPLDLVRRRKQLEGAAGRANVYKTGLVGTFGHIIQTEVGNVLAIIFSLAISYLWNTASDIIYVVTRPPSISPAVWTARTDPQQTSTVSPLKVKNWLNNVKAMIGANG
uniref:Mitochondrial substrate carrier family protein B n=1 Tax=Aegilops tauschii TaxID=37682 RepID=M8BKG3_AEGTA